MRIAIVATSIVVASCATAPTTPPSTSTAPPAQTGPRVAGNGFSVVAPEGFVRRAADPTRPASLELDHDEPGAAVVLYVNGPMAYPGVLDDARCHELSSLVIQAAIAGDGLDIATTRVAGAPACLYVARRTENGAHLVTEVRLMPTRHGTYMVGGGYDASVQARSAPLVLAFAESFHTEPGARAFAGTFSAPVPDGWFPGKVQQLNEGAVSLDMQHFTASKTPDGKVPGATVMSVPLPRFSIPQVNEETCAAFADKIRNLAIDHDVFADTAIFAGEQVCRAHFEPHDAGAAVIDVYPLKRGGAWFAIQCAHVAVDVDTPAGCDAIGRGLAP